jgi:hypothetical protein
MNIYAQADTIYIVKTDTVFMQEKNDLMYRLFVEQRGIESNHLWKFNLVDIGLLKPNVGYEHKLGNAFSVEGYLSYGMNYNIYPLYPSNGTYGSNTEQVFEFEGLFKYYYNLKRRERLGKKTYGFRGNYVAASLWYNQFDDQSLKTDSTNTPSVQLINLGIKYGLQRRIGNIGYIEFFGGIYYRWETISQWLINSSAEHISFSDHNDYIILTIGLRAGFAIDSFDNLRRMFKD